MGMNVRELLEGEIRDRGCDGLFSPDYHCACEVDDLAPCGEFQTNCELGVKVDCPGDDECELGGDCQWHIVPKEEK